MKLFLLEATTSSIDKLQDFVACKIIDQLTDRGDCFSINQRSARGFPIPSVVAGLEPASLAL